MKRKQILAWLLTLAMIVGMFPMTAFAEDAAVDAGTAIESVADEETSAQTEEVTGEDPVPNEEELLIEAAQEEVVLSKAMADGSALENGIYTAAIESSLGMFTPESTANLEINGDAVTLTIFVTYETTLKRYDHFCIGKYADSDDAYKDSIAVAAEAYGDGVRYVVPLTRADLAGEIYYCLKYKAGYSAEHDGDWYKPKSDPYLTLSDYNKTGDIAADADYAAVDAAIAKVPADLSIYTDESAAAVQAAVDAVVRGKKSDEQAAVDAMAKAIEDAIAALVEKTAGETVTVTFTAKDNKTGTAAEGITYTVADANGKAIEAVNGAYTLVVGEQYKITTQGLGYPKRTNNYTAKAGETSYEIGIWPINHHLWLQVCPAEKQYAESTPANTNIGEVVTIQKEGEEPQVVEPDGLHYVFSYLEPGATYTLKVVLEGYDVIIGEEWNVEKHGYYFETDGTTEWTQTVTMPTLESGEEYFTNLIARFLRHQEETAELDYTAVDDALAAVPENLRLFTSETADAVRAAVKAVDREAEKQEDVDAMAAAIQTALQGLIPKDGSYEVEITKYNATPYYLFTGLSASDREKGKAVLVVENGKMTAYLLLKNQSYGHVYLGTKEAAIEAANAAGSIPADANEIIMDSEQSVIDGTSYKSSRVDVPVPALQTKIDYAYHSSNTKYSYNEGWYDHGAMYLANSLVPTEELPVADETINLSVYDEELMFKAVNAYVEIKDGAAELVFALSGTSYGNIFAGTFDEAIANGKQKENWIGYTTADVDCTYETSSGVQTEGVQNKYQYRVPITIGDASVIRVPVIAISSKRAQQAETANPENPDYSEAFTARQFLVDLSMETVVVGNYKDNLDVAVSSELETFAVEAAGNLYIVGTPAMNEYTCQPTITMKDNSYDKAFIGTAEAAAAADEKKLIAIGEDLSFVIPFKNSRDAGTADIKDGVAVAAFHSVKQDRWIERTFTMDAAAKTIVNSGEELADLVIEDGTYTAKAVKTDVTTDASGMIMVTKATVVVKDGQAAAIVTMKGTGADRFYVSDTATKDTIIAEAVAEEQKEVGGEFGALLGGLKLGEDTAYSFWPVPITLGEPKIYAARSASHFAKQDKVPEEYYYVHDFQIDAKDLEKVSDSTDLPISAADEAQRYLNQYFLDGKVVTAATAPYITGKGAAVKVPYYQGNTETKISSFIFKMAESGKFRTGWFVDSSILNSTYFSSSNLKKIRYPEGANGTVTFSPKATYRDEGMTFTATLKLFDASASYNQYDADGVYYDQEPLAQQTFTFTIEPLPGPRNVTVSVQDMVSKEAVANAVVTITDAAGTAVEPAEGVYSLMVPGTYTVKVSAEGYVVPGTEDAEYVQADYVPKKDGEKISVTLVKAEEAKNTITFSLKDQMGEAVAAPAVRVYTWADKETEIPAEADGSYKLYRGTLYGYTVTAEGYEETTKSFTPAGDETIEVLVNKYLSEQKFTFRVYDNKTNETLEGVELVVKYGQSGTEEDTWAAAQPDENGVYTIAIDNQVKAYGSKEGYERGDLGVWSLGFEPLKECSFGLNPYADYTALDAAIARVPQDLTIYTEETAKAVTDAAEAAKAVERTLIYSKQSKVDEAAAALTAALDGLDAPKFAYEGKHVNFIKHNGDAFGMWRPLPGCTASIEGDNVVIHYVPNNKTTYAGFVWGSITKSAYLNGEETPVLDMQTNADGTMDITLSKEYCGYAHPFAVVKKTYKNGTWTSKDQYYLAIPSEEAILATGGHDPAEAVEETMEPTYELGQYIDSVVYCSICEEELSRIFVKETGEEKSLKDQAADAAAAYEEAKAEAEKHTGEDAVAYAEAAVEAAEAAKEAAETAYEAAVAEGLDAEVIEAALDVVETADQAIAEAQEVLVEDIAEAAAAADVRDDAVTKLAQLDDLVDPALYTAATYTVYKDAYEAFKALVLSDSATASQLRNARTAVTRAYTSLVLKEKQTLTATTKAGSKGYAALAKAKATFSLVTVKGNKGTLTYTKASGTSYATVNKSTGKITLKKGTPAGTYSIKVKAAAAATDDYLAAAKTVTVKITVSKAAQPMTAKAVAKSAAFSKVKKGKVTVTGGITVKSAQGTVTYTKVAKGSSKYLTIAKSTGKITVAKGTPKGTYKIKVKVKAAGNKNYKAGTKTVTVTVKVK